MESIQVLSVAERFYNSHKLKVAEYQKATPELQRAKCKAYNNRIKADRPERYQEVLEQKRKYYLEVTKPKKEAKKRELELQKIAQN